MVNCLRRHDQNVYLIFFQKLCLSGHQGFLFKWFQGENECLLGLLTVTTNSFENPITKNLKTHFLFFCADFIVMTFIPFLEILAKFRTTKMSKTQVHLFHANVDIKAEFTYFKRAFTNENIRDQTTNKHCP